MSDEPEVDADPGEPEVTTDDVFDAAYATTPEPEAATEGAPAEPEASEPEETTPDSEQGSLPTSGQEEGEPEPDGAEPSAPTIEDEIEALRAEHQKLQDDYKGRERSFQQEHRDRLEVEQQLQQYRTLGEDPTVVKQQLDQWNEYQQRVAQRPPWDPTHPAYGQFMNTLSRARDVGTRIQRFQTDTTLDEEQKARLIAQENAALTNEDRQVLGQFQQATQEVQANPIGYISKALEQQSATIPNIIRQEVGKIFQEQQARAEISDLRKENPDLFTKYAEQMRGVLDAPQNDRLADVAIAHAETLARAEKAEEDLAKLKAHMGTAAESVLQADAQKAAHKQRATKIPGRSGGGTKPKTIEELAQLDGDTLMDALFDAAG